MAWSELPSSSWRVPLMTVSGTPVAANVVGAPDWLLMIKGPKAWSRGVQLISSTTSTTKSGSSRARIGALAALATTPARTMDETMERSMLVFLVLMIDCGEGAYDGALQVISLVAYMCLFVELLRFSAKCAVHARNGCEKPRRRCRISFRNKKPKFTVWTHSCSLVTFVI